MHRIGGTCLLIQPTTSIPEIVSHVEKADCTAFFVSEDSVQICKAVFDRLASLPKAVYALTGESNPLRETLGVEVTSLAQLLTKGQALPRLESRWMYQGESHDEIAFLLATSGTSGKQVGLTC